MSPPQLLAEEVFIDHDSRGSYNTVRAGPLNGQNEEVGPAQLQGSAAFYAQGREIIGMPAMKTRGTAHGDPTGPPLLDKQEIFTIEHVLEKRHALSSWRTKHASSAI